MTFEEFCKLKDIDKLAVVEIQPARRIDGEDWMTPESGFLGTSGWLYSGGEFPFSGCGCSYYIPFLDGEVIRVTCNGEDLEEVFGLIDVDCTPGSWWYDPWNQLLYVSTPTCEPPDVLESGSLENKFCIMAYFWIGFANRSDVIYERYENVLTDGELDLWLSATDAKYWVETVGGASTINRDNSDTYDEDSAYSLRMDIDGANSGANFYQFFTVRPGGKCKIRFKYKNEGASTAIFWISPHPGGVVGLDANGNWVAGWGGINIPNSTEWTEFELEFTAHPDYSRYELWFARVASANLSIWFDYIELLRYRLKMYYMPFLAEDAVPSIYQAVGDYHIADERIQFGTLSFLNDTWWYSIKDDYNFHNKNTLVKIGAVESEWEDLELVFTGVGRKPRYSDEKIEIDTKDPRESEFMIIPRERFNTTDYPNLDPNLDGMVKPILLGEKDNITPPCVDTINHIYLVSQTTWRGITYNMQSIDVVRWDGNALATPADYTVDLTTGEITLTFDPGDGLITCDAHGLQCDFVTPGTYSNLSADIWYFILTVLNEISESRIHIASFLDLKAGRTQQMGIYLSEETETLEIGKGLKRGAIYQSFPLLNGKYVCRRYVSGITDETPRFRSEDYHSFQLEEDTDQTYKTIVVRYDQDPTVKEEWKYKSIDYDPAEWKHGEKGTLIVDTYLILGGEAETCVDFYRRLLRDPAGKLTATLPVKAMNMNPADKGIFSKTVKDEKGNEITVLQDEVYRILEYDKDVGQGLVGVVGIRDFQSVGYYFHSDVAHIDWHSDIHSDVPHGDDIHGDTPHHDSPHDDDHGDTPHQDTPHTDSHGDLPHVDDHQDYFDDPIHQDQYWDSDHTDWHNDIPHQDSHTDWHDDTPHQDSEHIDSDHTDIPHEDDYVDDHGDTPHEDSYI